MDDNILNHIFDDPDELDKLTDPVEKEKVLKLKELFKEAYKEIKDEEYNFTPIQSDLCDIIKLERIVSEGVEKDKDLKDFYENHILKDRCPFCIEEFGIIKKNLNESTPNLPDELMETIRYKLGQGKEKSLTDILISYKEKLFYVIDSIKNIHVDLNLELAESFRNKEKLKDQKSSIKFNKDLGDISLNAIIEEETTGYFTLLIELMDKENKGIKEELVSLIEDEKELDKKSTDIFGTMIFNIKVNASYRVKTTYGDLSFKLEL